MRIDVTAPQFRALQVWAVSADMYLYQSELSGNLKIRAYKEDPMRTFKIIKLVLGTCLVAAMALTAQAEAQTDENPQAAAYFEAGVAAYEVSNLPLAYQEFLAAAKEGHADAQFNVAMMYEQGIGVGKGDSRDEASFGCKKPDR